MLTINSNTLPNQIVLLTSSKGAAREVHRALTTRGFSVEAHEMTIYETAEEIGAALQKYVNSLKR